MEESEASKAQEQGGSAIQEWEVVQQYGRAGVVNGQFHNIDIDPPNQERIHYLVTCSYGDLTRSCRNRLESIATAWGHFSDVAVKMLDEQEELHAALLSGTEDYKDLFDSVMGLDGNTNI